MSNQYLKYRRWKIFSKLFVKQVKEDMINKNQWKKSKLNFSKNLKNEPDIEVTLTCDCYKSFALGFKVAKPCEWKILDNKSCTQVSENQQKNWECDPRKDDCGNIYDLIMSKSDEKSEPESSFLITTRQPPMATSDSSFRPSISAVIHEEIKKDWRKTDF